MGRGYERYDPDAIPAEEAGMGGGRVKDWEILQKCSLYKSEWNVIVSVRPSIRLWHVGLEE